MQSSASCYIWAFCQKYFYVCNLSFLTVVDANRRAFRRGFSHVLVSEPPIWAHEKEVTPILGKRFFILLREHCFGRENSLSSAANSVSSAKNSVSSIWHTNNRLTGTHWALALELSEAKKPHWAQCLKLYSPKPHSARFQTFLLICSDFAFFFSNVYVLRYLLWWYPDLFCWPGPSAENCRGFLYYTWRILSGSFLEDFSATKSGNSKIKIREKSVLPKTDPKFWFVPISSDLFRFVFRTHPKNSGTFLSADPSCNSPILSHRGRPHE